LISVEGNEMLVGHIEDCNVCAWESDIGASDIICNECILGQTPDVEQDRCVLEFCAVPDPDDRSICITCEEGKYQAFDTTMCFIDCPEYTFS
jgi:hypothetical protein